MLLKEVRAKKILDSREEPTIEVSVNGVNASSPSGKSKGKYETPSYKKSLDWNIRALNSARFNLEINSFRDLFLVEKFIVRKFKLKNAKQFGANALFALECGVLKALAHSQKKQLWQILEPKTKRFPRPIGNAVGGGLHSNNKDKPEFQEFLLIPNEEAPFRFRKNFNKMKNIHSELKFLVGAKNFNDEGAWQTSLSNEEILEILSTKISGFGIDVAASSFYKNGKYNYKNISLNKNAQIEKINSLIKKYSLLYIEDPLHEEDFSGFSKILKKNLIVGDDLTATQISRLKKAISVRAINAMIIKPNQNGSLLELAEIFQLCRRNGIKTIISHRSGETLDDALADLAFGFQADFIKCGIATKWREAKLKRLVEIEKNLK